VSLQGIISAKPQVGNSRGLIVAFLGSFKNMGMIFSHEVSLLSYHINSLSHDEGFVGAL
jgi:hypothetical protein